MEEAKFDVLIVGGGFVGASMAFALAGHGLKIGLVDAGQLLQKNDDSNDYRSIVLSYSSYKIFSALGLWSHFIDHTQQSIHQTSLLPFTCLSFTRLFFRFLFCLLLCWFRFFFKFRH